MSKDPKDTAGLQLKGVIADVTLKAADNDQQDDVEEANHKSATKQERPVNEDVDEEMALGTTLEPALMEAISQRYASIELSPVPGEADGGEVPSQHSKKQHLDDHFQELDRLLQGRAVSRTDGAPLDDEEEVDLSDGEAANAVASSLSRRRLQMAMPPGAYAVRTGRRLLGGQQRSREEQELADQSISETDGDWMTEATRTTGSAGTPSPTRLVNAYVVQEEQNPSMVVDAIPLTTTETTTTTSGKHPEDAQAATITPRSKTSFYVLAVAAVITLAVVTIVLVIGPTSSGDGTDSVNDLTPTVIEPASNVPTSSLAPSSAPSSTWYGHIWELVLREVYNASANTASTSKRQDAITLLADPASPQHMAMEWLAMDALNSTLWMPNAGVDNGFVDDLQLPTNDTIVKEALVMRYIWAVFYFSTNGHEWNVNSNWLSSRDICEWVGLSCSSTLSIQSNMAVNFVTQNSIRGTLPLELARLNNLVGIQIEENSLSGSLPIELAQSNSEIQLLQIQDCLITGTIPTEYGNMKNLTRFNMQANQLSGTLPTELGQLSSQLTNLKFTSNRLTGTIPTELGFLTRMTTLLLLENYLTGSLPTELGRLTDMKYLYLDRNAFNSTIPMEIHHHMPSLDFLRLRHNLFTGTIATEIGLNSNLYALYIDHNFFTGTIPTEIGTLSILDELWADMNSFHGPLPSELGQLTAMDKLYLEHNAFSGPIPTELGRVTDLEDLWLNYCSLTSSIPTELGLLTNLEELELRDNHLNGTLPTELGVLRNVRKLYLYHNELEGAVPTEIGQMVALSQFNLQRNRFISTLPSELGLLTNMEGLWLDGNQFTGTLPSDLGRLSLLVQFSVNSTSLTGSVPTDFRNITEHLQLLFLQNTSLTGDLDDIICNHKSPSSPELLLYANCAVDGNATSEVECSCCICEAYL